MQGALTQTTNLLEAALGTTSEKVSSQLGQFTSTASAESDRAADALRQTQATMILEMQQALEEATQRFNETATAMRATAREVGSELESTRSELARGVMELPEETRASAAAMRRVVAEQIEALSELNAIVRAQPATHDLNDGRRSPPPSPRREEPRREEPRPEPVREAPAARVEPVRPAAPRPAPQPAPAPVAAATMAPPRPAPAPTPVPAAVAAAKTEEGGGGWLRDVLRNASATAQPAAAAPAPAAAPAQPNLTNLTDEIARSMEQNALADAWARYQAGEQNVFSRRIYTLSGQGTYDQVRKRLQADAEFAKTSATYMAEFEQLLQQAAQSSNPAAAAREFLLSDRGKVYTMLAHASGRVS
jgi:flagellar motor protein MotB